MASDKIEWVKLRPYPNSWLGFCTNEKSYFKAIEKNGGKIERGECWLHTKEGALHTNFLTDKGQQCYIISIDLIHPPTNPGVIGLLAHECMHLIQQLWIDVGETNPGKETEAYMMQYILQTCLEIYTERWEAKKKKNKRKV